MRRRAVLLACAAAIAAAPVFAADAAAAGKGEPESEPLRGAAARIVTNMEGRQKAGPCAVCHGLLGLSTVPDAPNLAGQPALYVASQLRAYRGGTRSHEVMSLMAKPLSDGDINDLAAWFASLKVTVQPVP